MTSLRRVERIADLRTLVGSWRDAGSVGLVPTMGALHAGHERLIEQARAECARVVVSIFVNPLQFDRKDDLERYPRTLDADAAVCARHGVDALFIPAVEDMYPVEPACVVEPGELATHLCGAYRPGHFRGVATVVLKLLNIVGADRAYFGEKDAQQLAIVRRMVSDFNVPTMIVSVPTEREADGLALSSRNIRLNAHERSVAPSLYRALQTAASLVAAGERDPARVTAVATSRLGADPVMRLEYFDIVDMQSLQRVAVIDRRVLVAAAMWVGATRLIDNVVTGPLP